MERNTKILLGLGVVALGYYLYTKNKAKSVAQEPSEEPQEPSGNSVRMPISTPPSKGGSTTQPAEVVDKNYNDCVKEFNSSTPAHFLPNDPNAPKKYREWFIGDCLKRKQPNYKPQTGSISGLKEGEPCKLVVGGFVGIGKGIVKNGICVDAYNMRVK